MADNEYAIWRAIGSLTQRVRDLEHPTAPEPPKAMIGVSNGKDTIWHDPEVRMVDGIDKCPTCLGTGKVVRLEPVKVEPEASRTENITKPKVSNTTTVYPDPTIQPEASQPLPAEVEAAIGIAEYGLLWRDFGGSGTIALDPSIANANTRAKFREMRLKLASLLPKAGQVPSGITEQDIKNLQALAVCVDHPWDETAETGAWRELFKAIMELKPVQPSPVTAEKLAKWLKKYDKETEEQVVVHYSAMAEALLQAFPTLGQGRLTREQIMDKLTEEFSGHYSLGYCERIAADLLALQPKVSKEQWQKLLNHCHDNHNVSLWAIKAWLMAEFDAEVAE